MVYVFTNNTAIFTNRIVAGLNVDESKWCDEIVNYPWYGDIVPSMDGSVPDGAKLSLRLYVVFYPLRLRMKRFLRKAKFGKTVTGLQAIQLLKYLTLQQMEKNLTELFV